MSDSSFAAVSRYRGFLDVIDEEWTADSLSDDELDVPALSEFFLEDDEDEDTINGGDSTAGRKGFVGTGRRPNQEERWEDLGLDRLLPE